VFGEGRSNGMFVCVLEKLRVQLDRTLLAAAASLWGAERCFESEMGIVGFFYSSLPLSSLFFPFPVCLASLLPA
jgi:hypothetical protein